MEFLRLPTGMFSSNCYIIGNNGEGAVIDPGAPADEIIQAAASLKLNIRYILLTHSHIDHIAAVDELRQATGAQVLVHGEDLEGLLDSGINGSSLFGEGRTFGGADRALRDGEIIGVGGISLEIIHTPGHTPGSICIKAGDMLFTGDTLFRMSIGRTDLPGGSRLKMSASLDRLMKLPEGTKAYPGHGAGTTIGLEKKNNPFI